MFYDKMNVPQRYKDFADKFNISICTDWKNPIQPTNTFINIIDKNVFQYLDLFALESINIIKFCEISLHQVEFTQNVCVRVYLNSFDKPYILDSNGELNKANKMFYDELDEKEYKLFELIICKIVDNLKKSFRKYFWGIDERFANGEKLCAFDDYKKRFEEENGENSFFDYDLGNEHFCFCQPIGGDNVEGFLMQNTEY